MEPPDDKSDEEQGERWEGDAQTRVDAPPGGAKAGELIIPGARAMAVLPDAVRALIDFWKIRILRPGSHPE